MDKGKIISFGDNICLYCGEQKKQKWEDCESYYECDCNDAVKERLILEQIEKLKQQIPRKKFVVREEHVLYKLK